MNRSEAGRQGEDKAAEILTTAGLRIIDRNYRSSFGEVDLVALDGDCIVFVEVKSWKHYGAENLEYALNESKRRRIIETAKFFLTEHREYSSMSVRFDIVFISPGSVQHLASAFTERV